MGFREFHREPSQATENLTAPQNLAPVSTPHNDTIQRKIAPSKHLSQRDVIQLQRTVGNQRTQRLIQRSHADNFVQRAIENETYGESVSDENRTKAGAFFKAFNTAVQNAYKFVISVPSIGAYKDLNGYTQLWCEKWGEFLTGGRPKLMAATFGYVIESLVSNDTSGFWPAPPSGCTVYTQVTSGGTRPDLVLRLKKGGSDIAWLDLTASESADHIFAKEGWSSKVGIFAEVTYPSLDPGTLALMVQNKDNTGELSEEEFKKRQEIAKALYEKRKAAWWKMGTEKYSAKALKGKFHASLVSKGFASKGIKMLVDTRPELKREFIKGELESGFKTTIDDPKMIPSILAALGISPVTWNFTTGFSASERAGEAWLVDNDPSLEVPEAAKSEEEAELVGEGSKSEMSEEEVVKAKDKSSKKDKSNLAKSQKDNRYNPY